ncbi:MAG: TolB protein [Myxococcota bacterium]|jgi:TolB protein
MNLRRTFTTPLFSSAHGIRLPRERLTGLIVAAVFLCGPSSALAQTDPTPGGNAFDDDGLPRVIVGPTDRQRDRLAIPSVACKGAGKVCDSVNAQLARNFELSTYFELLDNKTFIANMDTENIAQTNWPDWFNVGSRFLVKGSITGSGAYDIELRFYNVLDKKVVPVKGQSHRGVTKSGVRSAVNAFINGVIESLTGKPGIFGSKIVYSVKSGLGTRAISMMEMDGDGRRGVVGGDSINMFPHFNPGGGVLFTSFRDGKPDLFVGKRKLTKDPWHYRGASFGPGGRLAASLSKGSGSDIYLLSGAGKVMKRLTNGQGQNVSPTWSPDGGQIAFVSDRAGGPQIYVMPAGGGGARRVTMAGSYNSTPHWGKSGLIAFASMTDGGSDIFTTDPAGGMSRITQDQGVNTDPCWSPNGQYIAFVSRRSGHGKRIWISSADGRWQFPVSRKSGAYSTPRWGM